MMLAVGNSDTSRGSYKLVDGGLSGEAGELAGHKKDTDKDLIEDGTEYATRERDLVRKIDRRIMPCLFAMIILK
jgi:hypothetical protein